MELNQEYFPSVPVGEVQTHPGNPRRGSLHEIEASIKKNGFFGSLIAQRSTKYVIVGNHRLLAARNLAMETVPVIFVDVDDALARKIMLVDNRTSDLGGYDEDLLMQLLQDLASDEGLEGTGYDVDDLDDLIGKLGGDIMEEQESEADYIEQPEETKQRQEIGGVTKLSQGLKEFVLVYQTDQADLFTHAVNSLRQKYGTPSTSETVLLAVMEAAK